MDAVSFTVRYLEVTRPGSASADNDGIVLFPYLGCIDIDADMCIGNKGLETMLFRRGESHRNTYNALGRH